MSNSLLNLVPVLDGSNYPRWSDAMKSYLQAQEVWMMVTQETVGARPTLEDDNSNQVDVFRWVQADEKAQGSIRLRLAPSVAAQVTTVNEAKTLWDTLRSLYGQQNAANLFAEFKAAINVRVPADQHPAPFLAKIRGSLDKLEENKLTLPSALTAMIALNALPSRYDSVVQVILQTTAVTSLDFGSVRHAANLAFEQSSGKKASGSGNADAKKISAVKRKQGEPNFNQQRQDGSSGNYGNSKGKGKQRGKRGGKKSREQGQGKPNDHAHIASSASVAGPSTSHVMDIAPSGSTVRTVSTRPPSNGNPDKVQHKWLKRAFKLADRIDVAPTIERLKTLTPIVDSTAQIEEYLSDTESRASKRSRIELDDPDMGARIDEVMEALDGGYNSWDDGTWAETQELLDWGSDVDHDIMNAAGLDEDASRM